MEELYTFGGSNNWVLSFAIFALSWPRWYSGIFYHQRIKLHITQSIKLITAKNKIKIEQKKKTKDTGCFVFLSPSHLGLNFFDLFNDPHFSLISTAVIGGEKTKVPNQHNFSGTKQNQGNIIWEMEMMRLKLEFWGTHQPPRLSWR